MAKQPFPTRKRIYAKQRELEQAVREVELAGMLPPEEGEVARLHYCNVSREFKKILKDLMDRAGLP